MCQTLEATGFDASDVGCNGKEEYHISLANRFGLYWCYEGVTSDISLVAFPRPFDLWYSIESQALYGDNFGREGGLRWRGVDNVFKNVAQHRVLLSVERGAYFGYTLHSPWIGKASRRRSTFAFRRRRSLHAFQRTGCRVSERNLKRHSERVDIPLYSAV